MARVRLVDEEGHPELSEIMGRIRGARRGKVINVYKLLLHSPALAEAWFALNNAVRWQTALDGRTREIVVVRIGHLCDAPYILRQHVPALAGAEGLSGSDCDALRNWQDAPQFSACDRAVLEYADALTCGGKASEAVFDRLRRFFSERQIVELTVLIGAYNMHARVLNAVELDLERSE